MQPVPACMSQNTIVITEKKTHSKMVQKLKKKFGLGWDWTHSLGG